MKKAPIPTYLNWSSGKDAMMALHTLQHSSTPYQVKKLLTTINGELNRVTMHGLHVDLLQAQAAAIGLPLETVVLGKETSMEAYDALMGAKMQQLKGEGFSHAVYGDIFLEDLRAYRDERLGEVGIEGLYPLWKKDTRHLLLDFIELGYKARVVCCSAELLGESFCGRLLDHQFLEDLPAQVDPCGENGEFHTFCYAGPNFKEDLQIEVGEKIYRTYPSPVAENAEVGYWFCEVKLR